MTRLIATSTLALGVLGTLIGCAATVPMTPAADAANPKCAEVIVRLPDKIDELAKRETDAQATGAWGSPTKILLTCGVPVPAPSELRCATIAGVDWLIDDSNPDRGVFTTYGRDPAVRVVVDHSVSDSNALNALTDAVAANPAARACTVPVDPFGPAPTPTPSATPAPTPGPSPSP